LVRQHGVLRQRVVEAESDLRALQSSLAAEQQAFDVRREAVTSGDLLIADFQQRLTDAREDREQRRQEQLQQLQENSNAASELSGLRSQQQQLEDSRRSLDEQNASLEAELQLAVAETSGLEAALLLAQQTLQRDEEAADNLLREREKLVGERSLGQQSLGELREQRSGLLARRNVLEDLEDRQEGFGIGVREILRRSEEADSEPWNLILGSVSDLLDVDMDQAALMEVALSGLRSFWWSHVCSHCSNISIPAAAGSQTALDSFPSSQQERLAIPVRSAPNCAAVRMPSGLRSRQNPHRGPQTSCGGDESPASAERMVLATQGRFGLRGLTPEWKVRQLSLCSRDILTACHNSSGSRVSWASRWSCQVTSKPARSGCTIAG
jgi:hypothetical protein